MSDRELSALSELDVLDEVGEMSFYEDALDFSDDDLKQLCSDTERHLRFTEESQTKYVGNRYRRFHSTESIPVASSSPKPARPQQSSSSGDNSSIERISSGPQSRSRQSTSQPRRRTAQRSDGSSNGNNDGWKVVNPLDYSCTPMLFQIDKQLQLISMQLRETQLSNSLQLKLTYRMIKFFISSKKRSWTSADVPFFVWALMFTYPLVIQLLYWLYKKHRHTLLLTFAGFL